MSRQGFRRLMAGVVVLLAGLPAWGQALDTVVVERKLQTRWIAFDGTVEAVKQSTVSAQTRGTVTAIHFDVNDTVAAGAELLTLEDQEQQARYDRARAALSEANALLKDAQQNYTRVQGIYERKLASKAQFDQARARLDAARARVKQAEAALQEAKQQLSYTRVIAPYGGIVTERHVEVGETVQPGTPLMSGLSLKHLRVNIDLPQRYASFVRQQQRQQDTEHNPQARVVLPDGTRIGSDDLVVFPYADAQTHAFRVRVELINPDGDLYPGMLVKVELPATEREALLVPKQAVMYRSEMRAVYVLDEQGRPQLRQVRLGRDAGDRIEVLAGLDSGERVVLDPRAALRELAREGE